MIKIDFELFETIIKISEGASNTFVTSLKSIQWDSLIENVKMVKRIKPTTLMAWSGGVGMGLAGGVLICQPQIDSLGEEVKKGQSEAERLQNIIRRYHEQFIGLKAKLETLQTKEYIEQAKQDKKDIRSVVMYQYAAKEYIGICLRQKGDDGEQSISEKENSFHLIFQKVLNGEKIGNDDARKIQNYVYPKYKKEIDNLIEVDFDELLKAIS